MRSSLARAVLLLVALVAAACGGGGQGGGGDDDGELGPLDPRCRSLCADSDSACTAEVAECEPVCQVRVAGVSPLCATCLLEGAHNGACGDGVPCCPDPSFPNSVLECKTACAGSMGVNPAGDHPICADLCSTNDAACNTQARQCLQECEARVQGVSGLCALCLLEGSNGGACSPGAPCCPDPSFPNTVSACASVCSG